MVDPIHPTVPPGTVVNQQPDGQGSTTRASLDNVNALIGMLGQLNIAIPIVFAAYRGIRDLIHTHQPQQPALSDEQLIDLMRQPADRIVDKANAYIAQFGTPALPAPPAPPAVNP